MPIRIDLTDPEIEETLSALVKDLATAILCLAVVGAAFIIAVAYLG